MPLLAFLFFTFAVSTFQSMEERPTLIYVGDPMCSWCYGISEEMSKVKNHFSESHDFELVMGGLRPFNTQTMVELKDFLTEHWEEVNHRSGQPFSYDILNDTEITYDTEPPCRAVVIVREMNPTKAFEFFKAIQKSFYHDNKNMHLAESYTHALGVVNIAYDDFAKEFNSPSARQKVQRDFSTAAEMGVHGFPTLLLKKGDQLTVIANGFATAENMIRSISKAP